MACIFYNGALWFDDKGLEDGSKNIWSREPIDVWGSTEIPTPKCYAYTFAF